MMASSFRVVLPVYTFMIIVALATTFLPLISIGNGAISAFLAVLMMLLCI